MSQLHPQYQSYLLRLWRPDGRTGWRIVVENVNSGERHSFSDLEKLHEFLKVRQQGGRGVRSYPEIASLACTPKPPSAPLAVGPRRNGSAKSIE
jgi:hypothetical protein